MRNNFLALTSDDSKFVEIAFYIVRSYGYFEIAKTVAIGDCVIWYIRNFTNFQAWSYEIFEGRADGVVIAA